MKPFRLLKAHEIEVRVGQAIKTASWQGVSLLLYKNARVDMDILDETVETDKWQRTHKEIKGNLYCAVGIKNESGEWVWKDDCGTESNTEKEKGEASDAFKRACVNWGIGRELYSAPDIIASCELDAAGKKPKTRTEFYVSEIGYDDNRKINLLKIGAKTKTEDKIVFTFNSNSPKNDKPQPEKPTLSKARQIAELIKGTDVTGDQITEFISTHFGDGLKTNDLTDEQFNKLYSAISKYINGEE